MALPATAQDSRGLESIPGYVAVVHCSACEVHIASEFVAVTMDFVNGNGMVVRQFQMPLCDECAAIVRDIRTGAQMAQALVGGAR